MLGNECEAQDPKGIGVIRPYCQSAADPLHRLVIMSCIEQSPAHFGTGNCERIELTASTQGSERFVCAPLNVQPNTKTPVCRCQIRSHLQGTPVFGFGL